MPTKSLILDIRFGRVGPNIIATVNVGGVPVRGSMFPAGIQFAGGTFPSADDSGAELQAVQSLLYKLSRTDSGDRDVEDARLGLQLELSGSSIEEVLGTASAAVSFELPEAAAADAPGDVEPDA